MPELSMHGKISMYVEQIASGAKATDQRTGQRLFNLLPQPVAYFTSGTLFDPFHKDLTRKEIWDWLNDHLIFDDNGHIIALFNNNQILWELNNE